ncbi:MAG: phospholipid/cholesterol/gamma-HCH transport system substrate-binding protein [Thermoleophilaceae bacterium]|nr:phospholipid/cholesterol/gamma-HCH transport system substrate-binding protein [Thermoleophilaceae bacterium]
MRVALLDQQPSDRRAVDLVDGAAIARLRIEKRYAHVYPNASVLLRPKTPLKDMVAELDPGTPSSGRQLQSGALLRTNRTAADVNLDEILATLDRDSRDYLNLLLADGSQALSNGGGRDLAKVFRQFDPLSRHVGQASRLVAKRRVMLKRLVGNLSQLSTELGSRDQDIVRFVRANAAVFRRFANQAGNLQRSVALLPSTLAKSSRALAKVDGLGRTLGATSKELDPAAKALGPALRDVQPFFRKTTPVFRDQIRPFAVAAQPETKALREPATKLAQATPQLKTLSDVLNAIVNELAYKSPGTGADANSFLFYVPWASHNTNSVLSNQDGIGPLRRGIVLVSCQSVQVLDTLASPTRNPTLATLVQLLGVPKRDEICGGGK